MPRPWARHQRPRQAGTTLTHRVCRTPPRARLHPVPLHLQVGKKQHQQWQQQHQQWRKAKGRQERRCNRLYKRRQQVLLPVITVMALQVAPPLRLQSVQVGRPPHHGHPGPRSIPTAAHEPRGVAASRVEQQLEQEQEMMQLMVHTRGCHSPPHPLAYRRAPPPRCRQRHQGGRDQA